VLPSGMRPPATLGRFPSRGPAGATDGGGAFQRALPWGGHQSAESRWSMPDAIGGERFTVHPVLDAVRMDRLAGGDSETSLDRSRGRHAVPLLPSRQFSDPAGKVLIPWIAAHWRRPMYRRRLGSAHPARDEDPGRCRRWRGEQRCRVALEDGCRCLRRTAGP